MNAKQRAIQRKRTFATANTFYQASQIDDKRSQTWVAFPQTAEKELSPFNRRQMLRKLRYLEANLSIVGGLKQKVIKHSVGKGIIPMPVTLDEEWNDKVTTDFINHADNPNVSDAIGLMSFWEMQQWYAGSLFSDGEAFAALVSTKATEYPQLQVIDPGEVEYFASGGGYNPGELEGAYTYLDGVKVDRMSRRIAYSVRVTDAGGDEDGIVDVAVENMLHTWDKLRPNQYRAITPFKAVLNKGLDAMDLEDLEVATYKLHSALAVVHVRAAGSNPGGLTDNMKKMLGVQQQANGTQLPTGQLALGANILQGAMIKTLAPGEDLKLLASTRNATNIIALLEWFYRSVAVGTGLSIELVWNLAALGGTTARINLTDLQAFFDIHQHRVTQGFNQRFYVWWLAKKFKQGYPMPKDPHWWKCHWLGPAKITGDTQGQIPSLVQALQNGFTTWGDFWASQGRSWKPAIRQRIREVGFVKKECLLIGQEMGVEIKPEDVFPPAPGSTHTPLPDQPSPTPTP